MKYIRTRDGISWNILDGALSPQSWIGEPIAQADTIEELCDERVLAHYFKETNYTDYKVLPKKQWDIMAKSVSLRLKERITDINYLGAIWVKGVHGEPILKSVAKMRGILPNGEIDWELL